MAWTTSTLAAVAGGEASNPTSAYVMVLDNGDIWWFLHRTPDPTNLVGPYDESTAIMKLGPDHIERVSAGNEGLPVSYSDPAAYLDGPVFQYAIPDAVSFMATDGQLIYMFGFYSQIKVFNPATLTVTTLAGASPTSSPATWDSPNYRTIKDSHAGLNAWLGYPWGGLGIDRTNRHLYFFAKHLPTLYPFNRAVGAQLRRMNLDGDHAVTTITGVLPDVVQATAVLVYEGRIIFGTRNHLLGVDYRQGGYGLASCALDGSDYQSHYVDSDPLGAAKPTGFSSFWNQMTVAGSYLVMANPVGTKPSNVRNDYPALIAFPIRELLSGNRIHNHAAPFFETVVRGGTNVPLYQDGVDGTCNYYMGNLTSLGERIYWVGLDYSSSIAYVYDYTGASIRTATRSEGGAHNITVGFSGKAIKAYAAQYPLSRSPSREVELR